MLFGGDLIMERILLRRLKRLTLLSRTLVFVLYGSLALPGLTLAGAAILRAVVLEPLKDWIALVLTISFLLTGILLSFK